jgi:hypothetical protein
LVTAGSLTLGGARGPAELLLSGGTLTLGTTSTVAQTGVLASQGYGGIVDLASGATLISHGKIEAAGTMQLSGDVTNATDGMVSVASSLYVDTGRFTNLGEVSVQANGAGDAGSLGKLLLGQAGLPPVAAEQGGERARVVHGEGSPVQRQEAYEWEQCTTAPGRGGPLQVDGKTVGQAEGQAEGNPVGFVWCAAPL